MKWCLLLIFALEAASLNAAVELDQVVSQPSIPVDAKIWELTEALQERPRDAELYQRLGALYRRQGLAALAEQQLLYALKLNPRQVSSLLELRELYRGLKRPDAERLSLEQAAQLASEDGEIQYQLGRLYMEPEHYDYKKAKAQYEKLKKIQAPRAGELGRLMELE